MTALPTLIDYAAPLPPARVLPDSKARWDLDPSRAAVLVHDLQEYFLRPFDRACPALTTTLDGTARILAAARAAGVPVFYTAQDGDHSDRGLQGDLWGPGMRAVASDTAIVPEVAPAPGDRLVTKRRYSAFAKTDLAEQLAAAGRDQLVITGVYAHIGITATALDAFQREVHPFVPADAIAAFTHDQHVRALDIVADSCGVVTLTDAVVGRLAPVAEESGWEAVVRDALTRALPAAALTSALADPEADLFAVGLSSLKAFELLDDLADAGVDIDFGELVRRPTLAFLLEQGRMPAQR
ncbi:isochorismatase family protein [Aeromicrobium choanae]|uniref:isochorismatase n=1 Tax=Aeromicrobium choanae TaxID=1736691 RepID=A0A1T4YS60_9ACTN|nr:isochorismatase family protein [Aeromicrobium choanae]SKB04572.1 bifunctional isochorismate lyase / aryl carrier protein [Aeromicrobium choanae]